MKKIFFGILLFMSVISTNNNISTVFANENQAVTVFVNDNLLEFDVLPIIIDDRTLVPMRAIFEALGCKVEWDEPNQKVFATTEENDIVTLFIGNNDLYKNYEVINQMDVPAQIMDGRTLVPLRAISEALDCDVVWVAETYEVIITANGYVPNQNDSSSNTNENADNKFYGVNVKQGDDIIMEITANVENKAFLSEEFIESMKNVMREFVPKIREEYESVVKAEYAKNKSNFQPFKLSGEFQLTNEDEKYMSYIFKGSVFWNGNVIPITTSATINITNNEVVHIDNIVSDMSQSDWSEFYINSFNSIAKEDSSKFYSNIEEKLQSNSDKIGFYLVPEGVVFYVAEGVIADYNKGAVSFLVDFEY